MHPFAVQLTFADGRDTLETFQEQAHARQRCTDAMAGEVSFGDLQNPVRVTLMVRDAGQFKAVWSKAL